MSNGSFPDGGFLEFITKTNGHWGRRVARVFDIFTIFSRQSRQKNEVIFSEFIAAVERGDVGEVVIEGNHIEGQYKSGEQFKTFTPDDPQLVKSLRDQNVKVAAKPEGASPWYMILLLNWFPILLLIGVWIFVMRRMQTGAGKALSFGKSRARLLTENQHRIRFRDVAGVVPKRKELAMLVPHGIVNQGRRQ